MTEDDIIPTLRACGISAICGSVIQVEDKNDYANAFEKVKSANRTALALAERMGGYYIPGFHIHPDFVEESLDEIEFMANKGIHLIGELVPNLDGYKGYDHKGLFPLLESAARHSMVVNFHTMNPESIDKMVSEHPNLTFVAAHPGEREQLLLHVERMKKYDNLYLDISGTGIFRMYSLRYLVHTVGSERLLFGTDYPTCNPGVYVGGVLTEPLTDSERENIFSNNAKRLLKLS